MASTKQAEQTKQATKTKTDILKPQDIFKTITALLVVTTPPQCTAQNGMGQNTMGQNSMAQNSMAQNSMGQNSIVQSPLQIQQTQQPQAPHSTDSDTIQRKSEELSALCQNLGIKVTDCLHFNVRTFNSATYLGTGQVKRLLEKAQELECNLIVFNNPISPRIQRNLEEALNIAVVDKQEIILQIFANSANTKEAKLQVQLAQLQYSLPRLQRKWADLSQQRGGVKGAKGSGEKQLELDRRTAQERIVRLKREISQIAKNRNIQRRNRTQNDIKNIAIVGYTNSGKSTLLNRLTSANVLAQDRLFATLDPTTRRLRLPNGQIVLITDTVGFVSDLPHQLIDAFRSTLEEAALADLLLIVLDASRPDIQICWDTTIQVLSTLNALDKPRLVLLNKIDLITPSTIAETTALFYPETCLTLSATRDNLDPLLNLIERTLASML